MNKNKSLEYCQKKYVQAMIFTDHPEKYIEDLIVQLDDNNYDFFYDFMSHLENYLFEGYIEEKILNRLSLMLSEAIKHNNFAEQPIIDLVSRIQYAISQANGRNAQKFYRQELATRYGCSRYLDCKHFSDEEIDQIKYDLFKSLEFDYMIAYTHSSLVSDEDFNSLYLRGYFGSVLYLKSIRKMSQEQSDVDTSCFNNRVLSVLEGNLNKKFPVIFKLQNKQLINKIR